jgi:methanogenic corrinoid protein MtbC1
MENEQALQGLYEAIVECDDDKSVIMAQKAFDDGIDANSVIEMGVKAIKKVGDDFEKGDIFIPELMLAGMGLEKVMELAQQKVIDEGGELKKRGVLIIGAVKGDVHTIGKDLVATLWRSKGYEVHDLGVDVSASSFLTAAKGYKASVIGLSALMSTTLPAQQEVVDLFDREGVREHHKIIVGGGVCNQEWADEIGADGYAEDAAGASALVEKLIG